MLHLLSGMLCFHTGIHIMLLPHRGMLHSHEVYCTPRGMLRAHRSMLHPHRGMLYCPKDMFYLCRSMNRLHRCMLHLHRDMLHPQKVP